MSSFVKKSKKLTPLTSLLFHTGVLVDLNSMLSLINFEG